MMIALAQFERVLRNDYSDRPWQQESRPKALQLHRLMSMILFQAIRPLQLGGTLAFLLHDLGIDHSTNVQQRSLRSRVVRSRSLYRVFFSISISLALASVARMKGFAPQKVFSSVTLLLRAMPVLSRFPSYGHGGRQISLPPPHSRTGPWFWKYHSRT